MTDLDDALDTSAPVWAPPTLTAFWQETLPGVENSGNPDAVIYMDDQLTGDFKVSHSLDDGLPDPVTMTTSNDASGSATVPLVGRPGLQAASVGWRTPRTETGVVATAGTIIEISNPSSMAFGDYIVVALLIDKTASTIVTQHAGANGQYWELLSGPTVDGTASLYVFGKQCWTGVSGLKVSFSSAATSFSVILCPAYARGTNPAIWVDLEPLRAAGIPEASGSAISVHQAPPVRLDRRGMAVSIWGLPSGSTAGPFAYGSTGAEIAEITTGQRLMMASTGLVDPGTYPLQATTSGGTTNVMMMASFALEVKDRPTMDARKYFSPFNKDSPVYGFDRDTAITYLVQKTVTPAGVVPTVVHSGQMADIAIKGRVAEMQSVSKTRIDMDGSLVLPVVTADRENCSIDWLATWVMARGGQYAGPAPSKYTRLWVPFYGSTHSHFASDYTYNAAVYYTPQRDPSGAYGLRPPTAIQGPFMSALYAKQNVDSTEELRVTAIRLDLARDKGLPGPYGSYLAEDWPFYDQMSKANSAGRLTFWVRGDDVDSIADGATYIPNADTDYMMRYDLYCQNSANVFLGYVIITLSTTDRYIRVRMGADHTGSTTVVYNVAGQQLPTDNEWHFIGVKWDYEQGSVEVCVDGVTSTSSSYATNGDNDISVLPDTESSLISSGGKYTNNFRAHVPVSDMCLEAGPPTFTDDWSWHYPIPEGMNAVMRPTFVKLQAVVESTPMQGWDLIAALARATMSHYRANETDSFEFLPPKYFGEPAQLVTSAVVDTEVNAADLDVIQDPSKTRNIVTIRFPETRVDTQYRSVLDITSAIEIIKGTSDVTFSLEVPAGEIHGQTNPFGGGWNLSTLSDAQIAAPATIPTNVHFFTANTMQDSTGSNLTSLSITASIIKATASSVMVRFVNKTAKSVWLTNNGDQVPFLRILGYGVIVTDGYVTQRDSASVKARRERALDVDVDWVQSRDEAIALAQAMVSELARPRPEVKVTVMGDPRRTPGQLVELLDGQGTQAEGLWRILEVTHNQSGGQYTQDLKLVHVLPLGTWDEPDLGWDEVNWAP